MKSIEQIVKSKQMIGEHSPRARVEIEGIGGIEGTKDIEWGRSRVIRTDGDRADKWGTGNFITRADGKVLMTYNNRVSGEIFLSVVEDEKTLYGTNNVLEENEWVFINITPIRGNPPSSNQRSSLQKLSNGELLLYVLDPGNNDGIPDNLKVYKSVNGLGTDFEYLSIIRELSTSYSPMGRTGTHVSQAIELDSGRLVVPYVAMTDKGSRNDHANGYIAYSDDKGKSWTEVDIYGNRWTLGNSVRGIARFNDRLVVNAQNHYRENMWFFYSDDEGETWKSLPRFSDPRGIGHEGLHDFILRDGVDTNYWVNFQSSTGAAIYALPDNVDFPSDESGYDRCGNFWQRTSLEYVSNMQNRTMFTTEEGVVVATGISTGNEILITRGTLVDKPPTTIPVTNISISRTKGMIGSSNVTIENKHGEYAPDGDINPRLIIPNKKIKIFQGYGENLHQTFTGLIDSVDMTTFPQMMSIKSRDMLKLAKDQLIHYNGDNIIIFNNNTIDEIFRRLAGLAGLEIGNIEESGLVITKKKFSWESYLDAFSWLEEYIGYQAYCDVEGKLNFERDGRPANIEIAHTFKEGEDIIDLGYNIDDTDLYRDVVVFGEDAEGKTIRFVKEYPAADFWNLPKDKILKIDARDADTEEKLERIADDAIYLMGVNARRVEFQAIAVPTLDNGDFIRVIEESSTISEVYRISGLGSNQDPTSFTMNISGHHHVGGGG